MSLLTQRPIELDALIAAVSSDAHGAVALFIGTVRNENDGRLVNGIEYSAYDTMAERELGRIMAEASQLFGVRVALKHRLGFLNVGESSVAIAAAHAHRAAALDGLRHVLEALKSRVPIWKREHYVDGTREWVDPTVASTEAAR